MAARPKPDALLDRSREDPLHAQLAQALRCDIQVRQLAAGTALPSESALCRQFGVARSVVRQALAALVAEGLIRREPGRPATVAPPVEHRRLVQRSTGLYEQFASTGTTLRTQVLRLVATPPPAEVAAFFNSEDTWLLERLRRVDNEPLAFVRTWLPRERLPDLTAAQLDDASLHRTLVQHYGLHPGRGRNRIRAVGADAALSQALEVGNRSPLLMLEGQGFDQYGRPLEWFTTWHRGEKLVFDVDVTPDGERVQPSLPAVTQGAAQSSADTIESAGDAAPATSIAEIEQSLQQALRALHRLRENQ
jgi:GntR family transcriptional regulator